MDITKLMEQIIEDSWKSKFIEHFPNCQYFDSWTAEENYCVRLKKSFAVAINMYDEIVEKFIYEYDPMLNDILNLSNKYIHDDADCCIHVLIPFDIDKQFILIKEDLDCKVFLIRQYDTENEAICVIKNDHLSPNKCSHEEYDPNYVLVNIQNTKPYFFGKGRPRPDHAKTKKPGIFYKGSNF